MEATPENLIGFARADTGRILRNANKRLTRHVPVTLYNPSPVYSTWIPLDGLRRFKDHYTHAEQWLCMEALSHGWTEVTEVVIDDSHPDFIRIGLKGR